jgi:hypothetical protein
MPDGFDKPGTGAVMIAGARGGPHRVHETTTSRWTFIVP